MMKKVFAKLICCALFFFILSNFMPNFNMGYNQQNQVSTLALHEAPITQY